MIVGRKSQLSNEYHELDLDVTQDQLNRFDNRIANGEYVQTIFPNLPAEEREFIKSGITPKEWNDQFGCLEEPEDIDKDKMSEDWNTGKGYYDNELYVDENER